MVGLRHGGLLLIGASLATLTACATVNGTAASSGLIAHDADVLALNTGIDSVEYGSADYSRDGRRLAERAHELAQTVESPGANDQDVSDAFERLTRSYDTLRSDADRSGNPNAIAELYPVTQDYLGIESDVDSTLGIDHYAERGGARDRS